MKLLMRLFVTAIAAVAANYFFILCTMFLPYSSERFRLIRSVAIWGFTAAVALYTWRHTASATPGLVGCIFLGAVIVGESDLLRVSTGRSFFNLARPRDLCLEFSLAGRSASWLELRAAPSTGGPIVAARQRGMTELSRRTRGTRRTVRRRR
jgi:hypothetical protein